MYTSRSPFSSPMSRTAKLTSTPCEVRPTLRERRARRRSLWRAVSSAATSQKRRRASGPGVSRASGVQKATERSARRAGPLPATVVVALDRGRAERLVVERHFVQLPVEPACRCTGRVALAPEQEVARGVPGDPAGIGDRGPLNAV